MRVLFHASVPKSPNPSTENEDVACVSVEHGVFVLSDGASESFAPREWATELTKRFLDDQSVCLEWVNRAIESHMSQFDVARFSWSQRIAALERGSFATLIGLQVSESPSQVYVVGIGDSVAVLCSAEGVVATHPYHLADQFLDNPLLLSTIPSCNEKVFAAEGGGIARCTWELRDLNHPVILLMTDALGCFFMREREEGTLSCASFVGMRNEDCFRAFVDEARACGKMRNDDTTMIVIGEES